jgi:hypothetical protein
VQIAASRISRAVKLAIFVQLTIKVAKSFGDVLPCNKQDAVQLIGANNQRMKG